MGVNYTEYQQRTAQRKGEGLPGSPWPVSPVGRKHPDWHLTRAEHFVAKAERDAMNRVKGRPAPKRRGR